MESSTENAKSAIEESEALMARVNSKLARFQQALDAKNVESKQRQSQKPKARVQRHTNQEEDAEKTFNVVAESAGTGLGIGAKPRDKDKEFTLKSVEQPLRKKLLSGQKNDPKPTAPRSKSDNREDEQEPVETKAAKKRKRAGFLDEILAERSGKRK